MSLNKLLKNFHYFFKLFKVSSTPIFTNPFAKFKFLELMNLVRSTVDTFFRFLLIETIFEKV